MNKGGMIRDKTLVVSPGSQGATDRSSRLRDVPLKK